MGRHRLPKTRIHDIEVNTDYFYRHQVVNPETDCWEWNAGMHKQGYGMIGAWRVADDKKIMTTTHRVAARIAFDRAIDSKEFVIHTCSNMKCCNPDHLLIGDRYDIHKVMAQNERYRPGGKNIYRAK
jgi:hypothetical protein